jgi:hypothetical protein
VPVLIGVASFEEGENQGVAFVLELTERTQAESEARAASWIGPDEGGYEYHLEQSEPLPGIVASYVAWGAAVEGSARDLLTDPNVDDGGEKPALESATDFLRQVLGDDVVPSKAIEAEARDAGIAWRTVRRAADELGVKKRRGDGGKWYWTMPKGCTFDGDGESIQKGIRARNDRRVVQLVQPQNVEQLGQVEMPAF